MVLSTPSVPSQGGMEAEWLPPLLRNTYSLMVSNQAETNMSPPSFAITGLGVKGEDTRKRALCSPEEWLHPQFGLFRTTHGQHHTQSRHQLPALLPFPLRAATLLRQGPNARAAWRCREYSAVMAAQGRRSSVRSPDLLPLLLTCLMEKGK